MELFYAKKWLKRYIKYNWDKYDEDTLKRKINWEIVHLSHRVYKTHGLKGHNVRQDIRKKLWDYANVELKNYNLKKTSIIRKIISYLKRSIGIPPSKW